jgi:hypothetical protein
MLLFTIPQIESSLERRIARNRLTKSFINPILKHKLYPPKNILVVFLMQRFGRRGFRLPRGLFHNTLNKPLNSYSPCLAHPEVERCKEISLVYSIL